MNNLEQKIWSYVHGEMDNATRAEFERLIQSDPDIRAQVEKIRKMDAELSKSLVSTPLTTDEEWANRFEAFWQKDKTQVESGPENIPLFAEELSTRRKTKWVVRSVLGLAACLVIALGISISHHPTMNVQWLPDSYVSDIPNPSLDGRSLMQYRADSLSAWSTEVMKKLNKIPATRQWSLFGEPSLLLRLTFRLTTNQVLVVTLDQLSIDRHNILRSWQQTYSSPQMLSANDFSFTSLIIDDIQKSNRP